MPNQKKGFFLPPGTTTHHHHTLGTTSISSSQPRTCIIRLDPRHSYASHTAAKAQLPVNPLATFTTQLCAPSLAQPTVEARNSIRQIRKNRTVTPPAEPDPVCWCRGRLRMGTPAQPRKRSRCPQKHGEHGQQPWDCATHTPAAQPGTPHHSHPQPNHHLSSRCMTVVSSIVRTRAHSLQLHCLRNCTYAIAIALKQLHLSAAGAQPCTRVRLCLKHHTLPWGFI